MSIRGANPNPIIVTCMLSHISALFHACSMPKTFSNLQKCTCICDAELIYLSSDVNDLTQSCLTVVCPFGGHCQTAKTVAFLMTWLSNFTESTTNKTRRDTHSWFFELGPKFPKILISNLEILKISQKYCRCRGSESPRYRIAPRRL